LIFCWLWVGVGLATPAVTVEVAQLELSSGTVIAAESAAMGPELLVHAQGARAQHGELTITAENTRWAVRDGRGVFEGDVQAAQGNLQFSCDRAEIELGVDSSVQRVEATGHIQVEQGTRTAEGHRAVFSDGRLVLTGEPVVRHGPHEMRGAEIIFEVGKETIECKSCTMIVRDEAAK
jgi:lipopolysaccharide transport protein LptA